MKRLPASVPLLQFEDAAGRPAPNTLVTISFSPDAPSALFASGMRTEAIRTDAKGQIRLTGLQWVGGPGKTTLKLAAVQGETNSALSLELDVPAPAQTKVTSGGSNKKWLWIALAAGGAVGAVAAGGMSGGKTPAPTIQPPAAIVAPAIGQPVITVTPP